MLKRSIYKILNIFYPLVKSVLTFQIYVYLAVGAANTLLNIGLFAVLFFILKHLDFALEIATVISFLITVITGFWFSKNFAFTNSDNEKKQVQKQFLKYFLVALQGQFSDYLITKALVVFVLIDPIIAYFISTVIMLILNYFLQKYFTFKSKIKAN